MRGTKKSKFIKKHQANRTLNSLVLKIPLSNVTLSGDILLNQKLNLNFSDNCGERGKRWFSCIKCNLQKHK